MSNTKHLSRKGIGLFVSLLLFAFAGEVHGQIGNIQPIIQAQEDASILAEEYLSPLSSGLGADLNSGWNSSAGARHPLGFSIQLRGAVATVPTADQSFDITNLGLNTIQLDNENGPQDGITPTISGDSEEGPLVNIERTIDLPGGGTETVELTDFNMPQGLGVAYVPAPMIQASVGLPMGTEVTGRIIPEMPLQIPVVGKKDYGDFRMFGLGLKHEIGGYIPVVKSLPLTFSLMGGFNQIELSSNLNLDPDPSAEPDPNYNGSYDDQEVAADINTYTVNLLVGKSLPIVSVYGGVGYEASTMELGVNGHYPIVVPNSDYPQSSSNPRQIETREDPISFEQKGSNKVHALVGGSVSLLFFDFVVEATVGKYTVVNAGIGIGI